MSTAGELATYRDYLRHYRTTLERQCADLTPEQLAQRSVPPSSLSLLGLLRHMAYVEHAWFQRTLQRRLEVPRPFTDPDDRDADFNGAIATQECVTEAFDEWRRQVELADAWLETQSDATMGEEVRVHGKPSSKRDILVHMVEEYARHCGHADLIREVVDGRTDL